MEEVQRRFLRLNAKLGHGLAHLRADFAYATV